MAFDFSTLTVKYKTITGRPFSQGEAAQAFLEDVSTVVHVNVDRDMEEVRDWCEDNFNNNWVYSWKIFYFKYPEDALMFKLKWAL